MALSHCSHHALFRQCIKDSFSYDLQALGMFVHGLWCRGCLVGTEWEELTAVPRVQLASYWTS